MADNELDIYFLELKYQDINKNDDIPKNSQAKKNVKISLEKISSDIETVNKSR